MRSIERTLSAWILGALTLGAMVVALAAYLVTLEAMHKVFDAGLKNVAQAVASYHHAGHGAGSKDAILSPQRNDTPGEYEIVTVTWTPQGDRVFSSDPRARLPTGMARWSPCTRRPVARGLTCRFGFLPRQSDPPATA